MSQIQAGGAAVVITARDQATPTLQRLAGAADAAKSRVNAVGTSKGLVNLNRVADQVVTRFVGIGVALGALDIGLRTAGKALVESLADPSKDFWSSFSEGFSETARQIPILGGLLQVLFAQQFASIDRIKKETEEIAKEGDRRRAMVEARNQGSADSARNVRLSELAVDQARLASSSRGFETEESLQQWRQLARQRAAIEAEEFERQQADRARREGVSEASVGAGAERFRQLQEESRIRAANALELIEIEYRERLRRAQGEKQARLKAADETIKEEAVKRLAAERDVAARLEELQLDQQDRLAVSRLDLEEQSLRAADTPASRVRQAEIEAQRQLIALQQQLDAAEARILDEKGLTADQRDAAIAAEREIAELQAAKIREASAKVAAGDARTEQASLAAGGGTFSSFAASRINTDSTALMREQVKYLQRIASNTAQAQGFGP
jgi:hypothetical protein